MTRYLTLLVSFLLTTTSSFPQVQSIKATRLQISPVIDGKLNDEEWTRSIPFSGFLMVEPKTGIEPSEKTEIRVIYDENNLYIGIRCYDDEPSKITANNMEHDNQGERSEDRVSILIDPFQNKRDGYIFIINPTGARSEGFAQGGEHTDLSWNGIWEANSKIDGEGWTSEIRIPFKTISFNPKLNEWGINVERYIARKQEVIRASGININSSFSNPREAILLEGIDSIKQGYGITFRPYALGRGYKSISDSIGIDGKIDGGFDLYKNITPNLVGAITYNTDFAETEVDQQRLNLTRFPLYYPEKRTFFLEGSDVFDFVSGSGNGSAFIPFYSRRIGLHEGTPVPIHYGAKLFGKLGNMNLSVLDVQTRTYDKLPSDNMFASRISQNILDESKVGIIFTNGDPSGKKNTLAGSDILLKTSRLFGKYNFSSSAWGVYNWNDRKGGHKEAYGVEINYPNDLFEMQLTYNFLGDSINPGLGFMPRQSYRYLFTGFSYMPRFEKGLIGKLVRQWFFEFRVTNYWNLKGELESRRIFTAPINLRTESGEHIEFNIIPTREVLPYDFGISEGVVIPKNDYKYLCYRAELNTASYRKVQLDLSYNFGKFYSGSYDNLDAGISLKIDGYATFHLGANIVRGYLPQGDFSENVYSAKLNLYLTPDLGLSNFLQYDDVTNQMGYNGKFFWQFKPGNIIYLVYNSNSLRTWDPENRFIGQEQQLTMKLQLSVRF